MKALGMVVLAGVLAFGGLAVAAEMEGKIQTVDTAGKQMVLDDGTKLTWSEDTKISVKGQEGKLEDLKEGAKVKASYEEKDGKNVLGTIDVTE
jgi:Cu/Ag efflux protein CusF